MQDKIKYKGHVYVRIDSQRDVTINKVIKQLQGMTKLRQEAERLTNRSVTTDSEKQVINKSLENVNTAIIKSVNVLENIRNRKEIEN